MFVLRETEGRYIELICGFCDLLRDDLEKLTSLRYRATLRVWYFAAILEGKVFLMKLNNFWGREGAMKK